MTVGVISEVFPDWICNYVDIIPQYICENCQFDSGEPIGTLHPKVNLFPNHRGGFDTIPHQIESGGRGPSDARPGDRHQTATTREMRNGEPLDLCFA